MKVKFTKNVTLTPAWRGNSALPPDDQFAIDLQAMNFADFMDAVSSFPTADDDANVQTVKLSSTFAKHLPKYATVLRLEDDDGPVDITRIVGLPFYAELAVEALMKLINISTPSGGDEKN